MGAVWNIFRVLPSSIKLIALVAVGIMLFKAMQTVGPYLMQLAVAAWLVAGAVLLRAAGKLEIADRIPMLGSLLDRLLPPRSQSAPISPSVSPPIGAPPTDTANKPVPGIARETARAQAETALGKMAGVDDAFRQLADLANQATLAQRRGLTGFGTAAPAIVLVLQGPSGTGKSAFARHAVDLLYGVGALEKRDVVELGREAVSVYGVDAQGLQAKLASALGGTLLIEDADWLVAESESGGAAPGASVTGPIIDFVQRNPGKLLVMCTASEKAGKLLAGDPTQRLWRKKVDLKSIGFANLDDKALRQILAAVVAGQRLEIEGAAAKRAEKLFAAWRQSDGADFRNAHAVRDLIDKASAALTRRVSEGGDAGGREASTITVADIEAAAQELGLPI